MSALLEIFCLITALRLEQGKPRTHFYSDNVPVFNERCFGDSEVWKALAKGETEKVQDNTTSDNIRSQQQCDRSSLHTEAEQTVSLETIN